MQPLFEELEKNFDDNSALTLAVLQLACKFEHQGCLNWAKNKWSAEKTSIEFIPKNEEDLEEKS